MVYEWKNIGIDTITNFYLYGGGNKPGNIISESIIRPLPSTIIQVGVQDYMDSGPGRFALGSNSALVEEFFAQSSDLSWMEPGVEYTKSQVATQLGIAAYGIYIYQNKLADSTEDYVQRTYVWNSGEFKLSDDVRFIVDKFGERQIKNYAVVPLGSENFDFEGGDMITGIANEILKYYVDPSSIGKKVSIQFAGEVSSDRIYSANDYAADSLAYLKYQAQGVIRLASAPSDLVELPQQLWDLNSTNTIYENKAVIYGSVGNDSLSASKFDDSPWYLSALGSHLLARQAEQNGVAIVAAAGQDTLLGGSKSDILYGGEGNDNLIGGAGNDLLNGGFGSDTYVFSSSDVGVDTIVDADGLGQIVIDGTTYSIAEKTSPYANQWKSADERITFLFAPDSGRSGIGVLTASYGKGSAIVIGDYEKGQLGLNLKDYIASESQGSPGINVIEGDLGALDVDLEEDGVQAGNDKWGNLITDSSKADADASDTFYDSDNNDIINSYGGDDYIDGGAGGDDEYNAGNGDDTVQGGQGNDLITGGGGRDILSGGSGRNKIYGDDAMIDIKDLGTADNESLVKGDWIDGYSEDDELTGSNQSDVILGGAGSDSINGGNGTDVIFGDATTIRTSSDWDFLMTASVVANVILYDMSLIDSAVESISDEGDDIINAGAGYDWVYGGGGSDYIDGGTGKDILIGGAGNDIILGGTGVDLIIGDYKDDDGVSGNDQIYGGDDGDFIFGGNGSDVLFGGDGNDYIQAESLSASDYSVDYIDGGDGDDNLQGAGGDDFILGGEGDDYLYGEMGDPNLIVLYGNDTIYGGNGADQIFGGGGNDVISGGNGINQIFGDGGPSNPYVAGNDIITGGEDSELIAGDGGDDTIFGAAGDDYILGDSLTGFENISGNDIIYAGDGNDRVFGGSGQDIIYGEDGDDFLVGDNATESVLSDLNDMIYGGNGDDTLEGGAGDDILSGGVGKNFIYAGSGNDILISQGNDWLYGGLGDDIYYIQGEKSGRAVISDDAGRNTLAGVIASEIEIILEGGVFVVLLNDGKKAALTSANSLSNTFVDNDGGQMSLAEVVVSQQNGVLKTGHYVAGVGYVYAPAEQNIQFSNVYGSEFSDRLEGSNDDNSIYAGRGNNIISAHAGNDFIVSENGNDFIEGGEGGDIVYAGAGDDSIFGGAGNDSIRSDGAYGKMIVTLSPEGPWYLFQGSEKVGIFSGNDYIEGGDGDDYVDAGSGDDVIHGGNGNDVLFGNGSDVVDGGEYYDLTSTNADLIFGEDGDDTIGGGSGNDAVYGGQGKDFIVEFEVVIDGVVRRDFIDNDYYDGGSGDDEIWSLLGDDTLIGGDGDDTLDARGGGVGSLYGGEGDDVLNSHGGDNKLYGGIGNDTYGIGGFKSSDASQKYAIIEDSEGVNILQAVNSDSVFLPLLKAPSIYSEGGKVFALLYIVDDAVGESSVRIQLQSIAELTSLFVEGDNELDTLTSLSDIVSSKGGRIESSVWVSDSSLVSTGSLSVDQSLNGTGVADLLSGGLGNDVLNGYQGQDTLIGGGGSDTYMIQSGSDHDIVYNVMSSAVDSDVIKFGEGIDKIDLWFSRVDDSLTVYHVGSDDAVTIDDWFASQENQVSKIMTSDGDEISAEKIMQLVGSMEVYGTPFSGAINLNHEQIQQVGMAISDAWG
ncbi:calcium-binding protein [Pseudomonas sp. DWP3-1-2]|uniref:calcium-binding protein n=1 Tax=Pseudomonas sp. DWP3-1-2 TaxID=2804645 RepID=UPI003CEA8285